jgi:iron complex outermembrane receptor protein
MAMRYQLFLSMMFLAAALNQSRAGGSIIGRVTSDGEPLAGVNVLLQGTVRGTISNIRGEFSVKDVQQGEYTVLFSLVGYEKTNRPKVIVTDGDETRLEIEMISSPVQTEQVVVTAGRREQSLEEVPVSISVMTSKELEVRNSPTVEDGLRYVPGVNITGSQVNIRGSSGYSRGAGSRVLLLVDGIPLLPGDTGELNFESIPVGQVDRVEVVKGASSALYGSNALGGVINIITKPIPEEPETRLRTYGGVYNKPSHDRWKWTDGVRYFDGQLVSHSRRFGDVGVLAYFSRQANEGYRKNDHQHRYNAYVKLKADLSARDAFTFHSGLLHQRGGQFLYWQDINSPLIPPAIQDSDYVESTRFFAGGSYNRIVSDNFFYSIKAIWFHNNWGYRNTGRNGINYWHPSKSDVFRIDGQSTIIADRQHTLTFGIDANLDQVSAGGEQGLFGNRKGGGVALYGQDEFRLADNAMLTFGARYDFQEFALLAGSSQVNPKVALSYSPSAVTTLRASFGRGFRVASVAETFTSGGTEDVQATPNLDLKPERSYSYEIGVAQTIGNFATLDFSLFRSDFDNLIEVTPEPSSDTTLIVKWRNINKARVQGAELAFRFGLFEGAVLSSLGYTYVDARDLTAKDFLQYRPRHVFYASTNASVGVVRASADFRFVSRIDRISDLLVEKGIIHDGDERRDIVVTDVRCGVDLSSLGFPLSVSLNVNNVFQYNYVELIGNMSPPRTYMLILESKL